MTYICIYFKIQDYIRIDCGVDVCLYTAYIDADDADDEDEKKAGNVFLTGVSIDASKVQHH